MSENIPEWITRSVPPSDVAKQQLGASREEMYRALELYYTHVKYVITIMFSLFTALFAILSLSQKITSEVLPGQTIRVVVGWTLVVLFPLAALAILIIRRYYEVYVSALVFAVRIHLGAEIPDVHPWFVRTIDQAKKWRSKVHRDSDFLNKRARSPKDTFFLYALVIVLLAFLSLFCGLRILSVW